MEDASMAMGKRNNQTEQPMFILGTNLPQTPGHPFYAKLNELLAAGDFAHFVEQLCVKF